MERPRMTARGTMDRGEGTMDITSSGKLRVIGYIDPTMFEEETARELFDADTADGLTQNGREWLADLNVGSLVDMRTAFVTEARV